MKIPFYTISGIEQKIHFTVIQNEITLHLYSQMSDVGVSFVLSLNPKYAYWLKALAHINYLPEGVPEHYRDEWYLLEDMYKTNNWFVSKEHTHSNKYFVELNCAIELLMAKVALLS